MRALVLWNIIISYVTMNPKVTFAIARQVAECVKKSPDGRC